MAKNPESLTELEALTAALLRDFEAHLSSAGRLSMLTVGFYVSDARHFAAWLRAQKPPRFLGQPDTVSHLLARRYLSAQARTNDARTVRRRITSLRALWKWLLREGRASRDPLGAIEPPRVARVASQALSVEDVKRLLDGINARDATSQRDRALLELLYMTGAGAREVAAMTLAGWDERAGELQLGAGTSVERRVPLGREASRALRRYLESGRLILLSRAKERAASERFCWLSERGLPLSPELMYQMVRRRGREAEMPGVSPHALRRACAVHLLRAGAPPHDVARLLGFRSVVALSGYAEEAGGREC